MKIQYSVRDYEHRFDLDTDGSFDFEDGKRLAEIAAADFHNEHDGWERKWPIAFTLYGDGAVIGTFDVELDVEPSFMACRR